LESSPPLVVMKGRQASLKGPDADRIHQQGYVGEMEGGVLTISDVEILYLLEQGKIRVSDEGGSERTFEDLLVSLSAEDPDLWLRYLLFSDLRKRGYAVKPGYGPSLEFRVYGRGAAVGKEPAKYLVYGVAEGRSVSLAELAKISSSAKLSKKDLVLAVIDRQGEITYYDTTEVSL